MNNRDLLSCLRELDRDATVQLRRGDDPSNNSELFEVRKENDEIVLTAIGDDNQRAEPAKGEAKSVQRRPWMMGHEDNEDPWHQFSLFESWLCEQFSCDEAVDTIENQPFIGTQLYAVFCTVFDKTPADVERGE